VQQLADEEGVSLRRMNQLLHWWGFAIPRRQGCRPLAVIQLNGVRAAWLDRIAAETALTPADCAARLLSIVLDDGATNARRMLADVIAAEKRRNRAERRARG
jgi:hypothetical protein